RVNRRAADSRQHTAHVQPAGGGLKKKRKLPTPSRWSGQRRHTSLRACGNTCSNWLRKGKTGQVKRVNRQRRAFLIHSACVALGFSVAAPTGCSISGRASRTGAVSLASLTAAWEEGIPRWLQEAKLPAV